MQESNVARRGIPVHVGRQRPQQRLYGRNIYHTRRAFCYRQRHERAIALYALLCRQRPINNKHDVMHGYAVTDRSLDHFS